jgi:hypothetical protein
MNMTEFLLAVGANMAKHPEWRVGQTYFNTLNQMDPEAANKIRGTLADPFYRDKNIDAMMFQVFNYERNN